MYNRRMPFTFQDPRRHTSVTYGDQNSQSATTSSMDMSPRMGSGRCHGDYRVAARPFCFFCGRNGGLRLRSAASPSIAPHFVDQGERHFAFMSLPDCRRQLQRATPCGSQDGTGLRLRVKFPLFRSGRAGQPRIVEPILLLLPPMNWRQKHWRTRIASGSCAKMAPQAATIRHP
jgi:hypothetical protein